MTEIVAIVATLIATVLFLTFGSVALAQTGTGTTSPNLSATTREAPVGHRQPTPGDLPPAVQKDEQPNPLGNSQPQTQSQSQSPFFRLPLELNQTNILRINIKCD